MTDEDANKDMTVEWIGRRMRLTDAPPIVSVRVARPQLG